MNDEAVHRTAPVTPGLLKLYGKRYQYVKVLSEVYINKPGLAGAVLQTVIKKLGP